MGKLLAAAAWIALGLQAFAGPSIAPAPQSYSICRRIHNQETCYLSSASCQDGVTRTGGDAGSRKCAAVDKAACEGVEKWLRTTYAMMERLPAGQIKLDAGAYACDGYLITLPGKVAYACIGTHEEGAAQLHEAYFAVEGACGL